MKSLFKEYGVVILAIIGILSFFVIIGFLIPSLREFCSNFIQTLTGSGNTV